ncbi:hypothetical protein A3Q56_04825 [Intoshia linei]|uniref:RING-type domain-containing protein n=1 Tax=Intoshia linei TaxID=1819745 RepID=A0A177AZN5_9BILA|nr:hypothetical protein A3Q56_04825 [Intoshia linei]
MFYMYKNVIFRYYCAFSSILFVSTAIYAYKNYPPMKTHCLPNDLNYNCRKTRSNIIYYVMTFLFGNISSNWVLINTSICYLLIVSKIIEKWVFTSLNTSELQYIKNAFWNFIFHKFTILFGVIVVAINTLCLWFLWFTFTGFVHLTQKACSFRLSMFTQKTIHSDRLHETHFSKKSVRMMFLLFGLQSLTAVFSVIAVFAGISLGWNIFILLINESIMLFIETLHLIISHSIHLWYRNDNTNDLYFSYIYANDFLFDTVYLLLDLFHHFHMLNWSSANLVISVATIVIVTRIHKILMKILNKYIRHIRSRNISKDMNLKFPLITNDQIGTIHQMCSICWMPMNTARQLPCNHYFHHHCIQTWFERDRTCPTCRKTYCIYSNTYTQSHYFGSYNQNSRLFVNLSRYISWFPVFTFEINRTNNINFNESGRVTEFPQYQFSYTDMIPQIMNLLPCATYNMVLSAVMNNSDSMDNAISEIIQNPEYLRLVDDRDASVDIFTNKKSVDYNLKEIDTTLACNRHSLFREQRRNLFQTALKQYSIEYLKFGFITSPQNKSLPMCLVCQKVYSNEAMKPSRTHHLDFNNALLTTLIFIVRYIHLPMKFKKNSKFPTKNTKFSSKSIFYEICDSYNANTGSTLKIIDVYLLCILFTGICQFLYCITIGSIAYNSFLAGFISSVAAFVLAVSLRIQLNSENASIFKGISEQRAIADFLFAHVILHLTVINMVG